MSFTRDFSSENVTRNYNQSYFHSWKNLLILFFSLIFLLKATQNYLLNINSLLVIYKIIVLFKISYSPFEKKGALTHHFFKVDVSCEKTKPYVKICLANLRIRFTHARRKNRIASSDKCTHLSLDRKNIFLWPFIYASFRIK